MQVENHACAMTGFIVPVDHEIRSQHEIFAPRHLFAHHELDLPAFVFGKFLFHFRTFQVAAARRRPVWLSDLTIVPVINLPRISPDRRQFVNAPFRKRFHDFFQPFPVIRAKNNAFAVRFFTKERFPIFNAVGGVAFVVKIIQRRVIGMIDEFRFHFRHKFFRTNDPQRDIFLNPPHHNLHLHFLHLSGWVAVSIRFFHRDYILDLNAPRRKRIFVKIVTVALNL
nr:MAG TPA: hypothetical protein [Caudoviricetes sp.]